MTTEKTDSKELARQARLLLATAKAVQQALHEVSAPELQSYCYRTTEAVDVFEEKEGAQ